MPGKSYGQRSLEGYSPWGHKESDMTEHTSHTHKELRRGGKDTQKNYTKKVLMTQINTMVGHSPRAGHHVVGSQVGLRKHY